MKAAVRSRGRLSSGYGIVLCSQRYNNLMAPQYDVSPAVRPNGAKLEQNVKEFRAEQFEAVTLCGRNVSFVNVRIN